jgi:CDP-diacylglycerol--serine O-phosphatidyltransferase
MATENISIPRLRGIYLLPNLFTTMSLFAGFYAVIAGIRGHFDAAAIAVFVAMFWDTLDGRVARLTNTQTAFGSEYDSLSDMVSFGLAPSVIVYQYALVNLGNIGWLVAFIYVAAVALRLARFNTQVKNIDKRYFQGLPCTAGAPIIASIIWFCGNHPHLSTWASIIFALITLFVAMLMVSNIRYSSFKQIDFKDRIPFVTLLLIVLVFAGIALDPPSVLFIVFSIYGLSGPVYTLIQLRKTRLERKRQVVKHT